MMVEVPWQSVVHLRRLATTDEAHPLAALSLSVSLSLTLSVSLFHCVSLTISLSS